MESKGYRERIIDTKLQLYLEANVSPLSRTH